MPWATTRWPTNCGWSNDALGRLTSETLSSSDSSLDYTDIYKYDLVGNRLTSAHAGPGNGPDEDITNTYNGDDELTKEFSTISGETDLKYDPNGSLTTSTPPAGPGQSPSTYGYDVRNKMTSADVNGVTTTYVYDDAGNRVGETTGGVTTFYLTDDANPTGYAQPIEQKASAAAAPTVTYVIGDRILAQADASGAVSYLLTDGHGSTPVLTNSAGTVTATFNYTAFGGALGFNPSVAPTSILYNGQQFDPGSGMYYMRARGYDPSVGAFTSSDPQLPAVGDLGNANLYVYAGANPVNLLDPSGHDIAVDLTATEGIGESLDESIEEPDAQAFADAKAELDSIEGYSLSTRILALGLVGFTSAAGLVYVQNGNLGTNFSNLISALTQTEDDTVALGRLQKVGIAPPGEARAEDGVPIYFEPADRFPGVTENAIQTIKDTNGLAAFLHYNGGGGAADANRSQAIAGFDYLRNGVNDSLDEYPFASTIEGGKGASVVAVPLDENTAQGRDLGRFYRDFQMTASDSFLVVPVPTRPWNY